VDRWLETQDWRGQGGGVLGHKEQGTCGGGGQVVYDGVGAGQERQGYLARGHVYAAGELWQEARFVLDEWRGK